MNIPFWSDSTSISHEHIHVPADFSNQDLLVGAAFFSTATRGGMRQGTQDGPHHSDGFHPSERIGGGGRFFSAVHRWELPWYLGGLSIKNGDFMGYYQ